MNDSQGHRQIIYRTSKQCKSRQNNTSGGHIKQIHRASTPTEINKFLIFARAC